MALSPARTWERESSKLRVWVLSSTPGSPADRSRRRLCLRREQVRQHQELNLDLWSGFEEPGNAAILK